MVYDRRKRWSLARGNRHELTATADVRVEHLWLDPVRPHAPRVRMILPQVAKQALRAVLERDVLERPRWDELDHAVEGAGRQDAIGHELEVEILLAQEAIHEGEELDDELVLAQVVAILEDDGVRLARRREELETKGEEVRLEDGGAFGVDAGDRDAGIERKRNG